MIKKAKIKQENAENIQLLNSQKNTVPPRSQRFAEAKVFTERFVIMRGVDYYMRLFYDGSSEFVRYDKQAKKWVFLCFPPDEIAK